MLRFISKYYNIRSGEGARAVWMFVYIFSIISFITIIKAVSTSFFLDHYGFESLPYIYILVALFSGIVIAIYNKIYRLFSIPNQVASVLMFSVVSLFLFWIALRDDRPQGWILYTFYIWLSIVAVIVATQYWQLASFIFNVREAKRLYSLLGAGAITGGIFGGYFANWFASIVGSNNLLLVGAFFLCICLYCVRIITQKIAPLGFSAKSRQAQQKESQRSKNPLSIIFNSAHLIYLACIVFISVTVAGLIDYQYSAAATEAFEDTDQLTAFFGFWLSTISVISLLIQILFTQRILKSLGTGPSLIFLPLGILIAAAGFVFTPALATAVILKTAEGSLRNSVNKSGIQLIILPVPLSIRNQAKAFIDVFIDNLAKGSSGLLLVLFTHSLNFSISHISYLTIALIVLWFFLIYRVRNEYINSFRQAIEKRTVDFGLEGAIIKDSKLLKSLLKDVHRLKDRQLIFILNSIINTKDIEILQQVQGLIEHPNEEIRHRVIKILDTNQQVNLAERLTPLIHDSSLQVRVEALRYIYRRNSDRYAALQTYLDNDDLRIKSAAILCAAREISKNKKLDEQLHFQDIYKGLQHCLASDTPECVELKCALADGIAISGLAELNSFLEQLINDTSFNVQQRAVKSIGLTGYRPLMPKLIHNLTKRNLQKEVRAALKLFGDDILQDLEPILNDEFIDSRIKTGIIRTIGEIPSQKSVNLLLSLIGKDRDTHIPEIMKALVSIRTKFSGLVFPPRQFANHIFASIENYEFLSGILYSKQTLVQRSKTLTEPKQALALWEKSIEEKLEWFIDFIFQLLSLRYSPIDMKHALSGIRSSNSQLSSNAIEFLDNLLTIRLKEKLIPLIELHINRQKGNIKPENGIQKISDSVERLLSGNDQWLRACTLYLISFYPHIVNNSTKIDTFIDDSDEITRETALFAAKQFESNNI